jgi:hypothetical protein
MRRLSALVIFASLAWFAPATHAESHNPADYPSRIHIYRRNETTFYHNQQTEGAKGEGRANLFEGGEPKGVDFQFECDTRLQTSSGYETFPAKWKKPGQELVILQQQFGKPNYDTCRLKVLMNDFVYVSHNGSLTTEPIDVFKQWMAKHDYDPEHGKNTPTRTAPENTPAGINPAGAAPSGGNTAPPQPAPPPQ